MEVSQALSDSFLVCTFNHERSSIIYLCQPASQEENPINEIVEMDLHTKTILERYVVSSQLSNSFPYNMIVCRKKGWLIMSFGACGMEIWRLGGEGGVHQSIWCGETRGKNGYEIENLECSNLDGTLFYSAVGQRNVYCVNIEENMNMSTSKLQLPLKVSVLDLKCHPQEYKVCGVCSDGMVRIWNYNTFTELKGIGGYSFSALSIQQDGQKLICGTENGELLCWDGKTLGGRNILLAQLKLVGVLSLCWLCYNGGCSSDDLLCYGVDGNVRMLSVQLDVPQSMIRDQRFNKGSKKVELFGRVIDMGVLSGGMGVVSKRWKSYNLGLSRFIKVHPYANYVSISQVVKVGSINSISISNTTNPTTTVNPYFQFNTRVIHLSDKRKRLVEYPICAKNYEYSMEELIPDKKNRVICNRYLYYIEQQEVKQYCMSKGLVVSIANLRNLISEDVVYEEMDYRPKRVEYSKGIQLLISYKIQNNLRTSVIMIDDGIASEDVQELPCSQALYLGKQEDMTPPIYLLHYDKQSYSIIINNNNNNTLQQQYQQDNNNNNNSNSNSKQTLNIKVNRVFNTPFRNGYVVLYQSDNLLRFSKNRIEEPNNLNDYLMLNTYSYKINIQETLIDLQYNRHTQIAALITNNNLYLLNHNLTLINTISLHLNSNILTSFWLANTLLLQTKYHLHYLHSHLSLLHSIDHYEHKNILIAALWDRTIILSSHKRIEVKLKPINLLQPILHSYLHFNPSPNPSLVQQLILIFHSLAINHSLIQPLLQHQMHSFAHYLLNLDDAVQFTTTQKLRFHLQSLDTPPLIDTLFPNSSPINSPQLLQNIITLLNHPKSQPLKAHLQLLAQYAHLTQAHKTYAVLQSILSSKPIPLPTLDSHQIIQLLNANSSNTQQINITLAQSLNNTSSDQQSPYKTNINLFLQQLQSQQHHTSNHNHNLNNLPPSYYFTAELLQKLTTINTQIPIQKKTLSFGEQPYHLVYWDHPTEDDEEEPINGQILREFDQLTFDNIQAYLGLTGQTVIQIHYYYYLIFIQQQRTIAKQNMQDGEQERGEENRQGDGGYDFDEDDDAKEFQDLLIYWRIDEGKGVYLEDMVNDDQQADIYQNGEIASSSTEALWEKLEEGEPMEQEDKWGKKCDAQYGLLLGREAGVQSRKKNWSKKKPISQFSIEFWIRPLSENGIIMLVGSEENLSVHLQNQIVSVTVQGKSLKFQLEQEDEQNEQTFPEPKVQVSQWNHVCLSYEKENCTFYVYINARHSYQQREVDLQPDLFRDKFIVLGKTQNQVKIFYVDCLEYQITEFRLWKQKVSLNEIKDSYKTPLAIVAEKKRNLKMKLKEKKEIGGNPLQDLKKFAGFLSLDPFQAEQQQPQDDIPEQEIYKSNQKYPQKILEPIQFEPPEDDSPQKPISQSNLEFGGFATNNEQQFGSWGGEQPSTTTQFGGFDTTFVGSAATFSQFDSTNSGGFASFATSQQQVQWGEFAGICQYLSIFIYLQSLQPNQYHSHCHNNKCNSNNSQRKKQQQEKIMELKSKNLWMMPRKISHSNRFNEVLTIFQKPQKQCKNIQKDLRQISLKRFRNSLHIVPHIDQPSNYLQEQSKWQAPKIQKRKYSFTQSQYIQIQSPYIECIILFKVSIINALLKQIGIKKCLEYSNSAMAEALYISLAPNLDKNKPQQQDSILLTQCKQKLDSVKEKQNLNLLKMVCPNCQKHFHYKVNGLKKCSKCQQDFLLCSQTLSCIQKSKALRCASCESLFSPAVRKVDEQCPICKLGKLQC